MSLDRLFPPLTADAFVAGWWPRRHLVAHGPIGRLGELATLPELLTLDRLLDAYADKVRVALPDKRDEHSSIEVAAAEAARLHGQGMALIFNAVERFLPPVRYWLDALRVELGLPRHCDPRAIVYVSPAGAGNSPHFDANANFVVQVRGTKRWTLAPNTHVVNPTDRWAMNQGDPAAELERYLDQPLPEVMPASAETVVLSPGSVLFVPRGYWHATESDEETLALNFTFGQPSWADVVLAALRTKLLADPQWRDLAQGGGTLVAYYHGPLQQMLARLPGEAAALGPDEVLDAMDGQPAWLLVPKGFLRVEDGVVRATLGAGEFLIDADAELHPVLEWIGRQRTPFTLEQVALHFPALTPGLPNLLQTLTSQRLLSRHHCRPSPDRD